MVEFVYAFRYILRQISEIPFWYVWLIVFTCMIIVIVSKRIESSQSIKWGIMIVLAVYIFFMLFITVINRDVVQSEIYRLEPFWSWRSWIINGDFKLFIEIILNIMLYIPIGLLFALVSNKIKLKQLIVIAISISYFIELLQLLFRRGCFELVDDPLDNLIGAVIGFTFLNGVRRINIKYKNIWKK